MGRFILRKGRPRKDGKVTLTLSGFVGGHRNFAGTGLAVHPDDWDDFRQQVRRAMKFRPCHNGTDEDLRCYL